MHLSNQLIKEVADEGRKLYCLRISLMCRGFESHDLDLIVIRSKEVQYPGELDFQLDITGELINADCQDGIVNLTECGIRCAMTGHDRP